MLTLLLLIPLLGSLIILPMSNTLESQNQMKKIALTTSLINFFISLFLWYEFDSSCATQFQFVSEFNQLSFCHLNFGVDGISLYFVLLTTFITPIALLSNYTNISPPLPLAFAREKGSKQLRISTAVGNSLPLGATHPLLNLNSSPLSEVSGKNLEMGPAYANPGDKKLKFFLISFLVLETLQICAFVSLDLLLFYIFFESVK